MWIEPLPVLEVNLLRDESDKQGQKNHNVVEKSPEEKLASFMPK